MAPAVSEDGGGGWGHTARQLVTCSPRHDRGAQHCVSPQRTTGAAQSSAQLWKKEQQKQTMFLTERAKKGFKNSHISSSAAFQDWL